MSITTATATAIIQAAATDVAGIGAPGCGEGITLQTNRDKDLGAKMASEEITPRKTMTKGERDQLLQLVKKRERVMKVKGSERSALLLAEFDVQSAKIHHWDEDAVWSRVKAEADKAIEQAQIAIAGRCSELGIPAEFAPGLQMFWHGRGHNAAADRRAELRRAAKSRIEAIEKEAQSKIEAMSLDAQTEIVAHGLESDAAKAFLETMPSLDALMPPVQVSEIQSLIEAKRAERRREIDYLN